MQLEIASHSDVGSVRDLNQDAMLVRPELGLFAVADGMGGEMAGEEASAQVVATLERELKEILNGSGAGAGAIQRALCDALMQANQEVLEIGRRYPQKRGLGSTASVLCLRKGLALLAHVGDSRIYLVRGRRLRQLTRDHSVVWQLYECGALSRSQMELHPDRHLLTQCIGDPRSVQVDLMQERVEAGDLFLICSDGLTGYTTEDQVFRVLVEDEMTPQAKAQRLVEMAINGGGGDNISAIVVQATALDAEDLWEPETSSTTITMEPGLSTTRTAAPGDIQPFMKSTWEVERRKMTTAGRQMLIAAVLFLILVIGLVIYALRAR